MKKVIYYAIMMSLFFCSCDNKVEPETKMYCFSWIETPPATSETTPQIFDMEYLKGIPYNEVKLEDVVRKGYSSVTKTNWNYTLCITGDCSSLTVVKDEEINHPYTVCTQTQRTYIKGRYNTCNDRYTVVVTSESIKVKFYGKEDSELEECMKLEDFSYVILSKTDKTTNDITNETTTEKYACNDGSLRFSSDEFAYAAEPNGSGYLLRQFKPKKR